MQERTTGLILRTYPLTETSLIVHWLTADWGRIATVAKGARGPKSPFQGKLDLFYLAEFSFHHSRRSELHTLCEVSLLKTHPSLRQELIYLQQAAHGSALIEQATERETPLPNLFRLFLNFLDHLTSHPSSPVAVFSFELKLLHELGLKPDTQRIKLSAGSRQLVEKLLEMEWSALANLKLTPAQSSSSRPARR